MEREKQYVPVVAAQSPKTQPESTESEITGLDGQSLKSETWKAYKAAASDMRVAEWVQRIEQGEMIQDVARETSYALSTVKQRVSNHRLYFKVCEKNGIDPEGDLDV